METQERLAFVRMLKARLARSPRSRTEVVASLTSIGLLTPDGALAPAYGGAGDRNPSDFEMSPGSVTTPRARPVKAAGKLQKVAAARKPSARKLKAKAGA